ncbi:MAG: hypothetical protein ACPIOQ_10705, partial [Promethearchaeia archaeon]
MARTTRAAAGAKPAARPTSAKQAAAGAKQATKPTSSRATAAATPGTATGPLAELLALSAADAEYETAMAMYGALGVVELRAMCAGAGLGPAKNAKIPGCLSLIRNHALGNAAKAADAAKAVAAPAAIAAASAPADKAQPGSSALAVKAQSVRALPAIPSKRKRGSPSADAGDAAVLSSDDEDSGASLSATPVKAAGEGWPTIALLCQEGVITSRLASAMQSEACASVESRVLVQVTEGLRPHVHTPGTDLKIGVRSAVQLDVSHIARLSFVTGAGVKVPLPATTAFSAERKELIAAVTKALLLRVPRRLEVASRDQFDEAFHTLVGCIFGIVYSREELKGITKEYAAARKAAGGRAGGTSATEGVVGKSAVEFLLQFKTWTKRALEYMFFDNTELACLPQAKKMAETARANPPALCNSPTVAINLLRAPFDLGGKRLVDRKLEGTVFEASGGGACGVTAFDAETTAVKEASREAARFSNAQHNHCVRLLILTYFAVVVDLSDNGVKRFSRDAAQRALAAAQRLANMTTVAPSQYASVVQQAFEKAATVLDEADPEAAVPKDGLVGAAFVVFTQRVLDMIDHYALTASVSVAAGVVAPARQQQAPGGPPAPTAAPSAAAGAAARSAVPPKPV